MPDPVGEIADRIVEALRNSGAHLRIGKVTEAQADGARVKVDFADEAWVPVDKDVDPKIGDRVYVLQQGPVLLVCGKIGATPQDTGMPVGALTQYAGLSTTTPGGWLRCEGQAVSRTDFALLFARLGTTYGGGNGTTTFNLPDLRNRVPLGQGSRGLGATGGAERVTLSAAEMPAHDHSGVGGHTHNMTGAATDVTVQSGTGVLVGGFTDGPTGSGGAHSHAMNGSSSSHENMQPFVVLYYIIRVV